MNIDIKLDNISDKSNWHYRPREYHRNKSRCLTLYLILHARLHIKDLAIQGVRCGFATNRAYDRMFFCLSGLSGLLPAQHSSGECVYLMLCNVSHAQTNFSLVGISVLILSQSQVCSYILKTDNRVRTYQMENILALEVSLLQFMPFVDHLCIQLQRIHTKKLIVSASRIREFVLFVSLLPPAPRVTFPSPYLIQ